MILPFPVSFASRSLRETEKNYAQREKELLAFAFEKHHNLVHGHKVCTMTNVPSHYMSLSQEMILCFKMVRYGSLLGLYQKLIIPDHIKSEQCTKTESF